MANIQIPVTENGIVTLATAGKYCDRNIDILVDAAGGAETAVLTFTNNQSWSNAVVYVNEAQTAANITITPGSTMELTVIKNSIIQVGSLDEIDEMSGGIAALSDNLYFVSGDGTFVTKQARD